VHSTTHSTEQLIANDPTDVRIPKWKSFITKQTQDTPNQQRIVLLPGPHKSASTSVQAYIVQLSRESILAYHNWHWVGKKTSKGFSDIARFLLYQPDDGKKKEKMDKFQQLTFEEWNKGNHLIVAAEFMDYVASLSREEAKLSIDRLLEWLPPTTNREAVIMYRSPRTSHLISSWKQQVHFRKASTTLPWREVIELNSSNKRLGKTKKQLSRNKFGKSPTLAEWLCYGEYPQTMKYEMRTILSSQLNPFGVAYAYQQNGVNVTLMYMSGVPDGDVPSSVVCNVLNLPCNDGKMAVKTEAESANKNHKSEWVELGMSDSHLAEAEKLIRDMDCYYYCLLGESVNVLHASDEVFMDGKMSWETCCQRNNKKSEETDGRWMAGQLIQLGCRAVKE
jgi:hypothetical protein